MVRILFTIGRYISEYNRKLTSDCDKHIPTILNMWLLSGAVPQLILSPWFLPYFKTNNTLIEQFYALKVIYEKTYWYLLV